MKKLLLLFAVAISAFCCYKDNVRDNAIDGMGKTLLNLSIPAPPKTSLGDKVGNRYPTYWSEGDRIVADGIVSDVAIISDDRVSASFEIPSDNLVMPYNITYPYSEGSLCTKDRPTVVFPSVQNFVEGSFGSGYAPMYGYCEQSSTMMNHLAGVLRFAVNGSTTLGTIEIIASEDIAIAGEFDVDCQTGDITAIADKKSNKITYVADQPLSTTESTYLHITLPHGNLGECQVVVTATNGSKMVLKLDGSNIKPGVVREFKPFSIKAGESFTLEELEVTDDKIDIPISGYVFYDDNTPAVGVSVSDGFSVVTTNEKGLYHFENGVDYRTRYIYNSLPADAKAKVTKLEPTNYLDIFKEYKPTTSRYDFKLEKIEKESEFSLFVIADTHGHNSSAVKRLQAECVGGVKSEKLRKGSVPCYAIVLGDIVCTAYTHNDEKAAEQLKHMDDMRNTFSTSQTNGVATLFVMGNHDYDIQDFRSGKYTTLDDLNYHAQDAYEKHFGPANYSINRGDTHIVCMRDILWPQSCIDNLTSEGCYVGFTDYQIEWLRQDLANVPKDKKVILCVHIQLLSAYTKYESVKTVVDMILEYNEPQIFSGHNHENLDYKAGSINFSYTSPVSEKNVVGNWANSSSKCMGDGSPFGFDVYDIRGNQFTDHYYVDCTSNKSHNIDTDYVMRTYISSDVYGGDSDGDGMVYTAAEDANHERYFRFYSWTAYDSNNNLRYDTYLHVNVFNGSPDTWSVKLYVNNVFVKNLAWVNNNTTGAWNGDPDPKVFDWKGNGSGTKEDPWIPSNKNNSMDWWLISYYINETASTSTHMTNNRCWHKWYGYIPVEYMEDIRAGNFYIEATHTEFGNTKVYRTSKIFGQNDYNGYVNYNPVN